MCLHLRAVILDRYQSKPSDFYRPHPKDDGRLYFHFVHTCRGGGTPSQVWVGGYPISGLGRGWGVPHPRSG